MKRILAAALCLVAVPVFAAADMNWPASLTEGQAQLKALIETANDTLDTLRAPEINTTFEVYPTFASLGYTENYPGDSVERVELLAEFDSWGLSVLTVEVQADSGWFTPIAAACLAAADEISADDAVKTVEAFEKQVDGDRLASVGGEADTERGEQLSVSFAYYPNRYEDGVDWLTMTLVFQLPLSNEGGLVTVTPEPRTVITSEDEPDYEDYAINDGYAHYEVVTTETPNPDDGIIKGT